MGPITPDGAGSIPRGGTATVVRLDVTTELPTLAARDKTTAPGNISKTPEANKRALYSRGKSSMQTNKYRGAGITSRGSNKGTTPTDSGGRRAPRMMRTAEDVRLAQLTLSSGPVRLRAEVAADHPVGRCKARPWS